MKSKKREISIKDLFNIDRPQLKENLSVPLWRILRFNAMENISGKNSDKKIYDAGKIVGKTLESKSLEEFITILTDLGVGECSIRLNTDKKIIIDVDECVTCSGIKPPIGKVLCFFEAGIVAGQISKLKGKELESIETLCDGGKGDETCRIEVNLD